MLSRLHMWLTKQRKKHGGKRRERIWEGEEAKSRRRKKKEEEGDSELPTYFVVPVEGDHIQDCQNSSSGPLDQGEGERDRERERARKKKEKYAMEKDQFSSQKFSPTLLSFLWLLRKSVSEGKCLYHWNPMRSTCADHCCIYMSLV